MTSKQWAEEYCGEEGICQLCGNAGVIVLPLRMRNGRGWGGNHYCICPNGRCLRRLDKQDCTDSRVAMASR